MTTVGAQWTPSHSGYQLVKYADGSVAIVAYDVVKGWEWGTTAAPNSTVVSVQNLGEHPRTDPTAWEAAIVGLPDAMKVKITNLFENGTDPEGGAHIPLFGTTVGGHNPTGAIVIQSSGKSNTGVNTGSLGGGGAKTVPGETGGNTNPISVPDPLSAISAFLSFFTSTAFWKGVGLCVAGGLILIFAALEFLKMGGVSAPTVRVG